MTDEITYLTVNEDAAGSDGYFVEIGRAPGRSGQFLFVGDFARNDRNESRNHLRGMSASTAMALAEKLIEMAGGMRDG